ncbi:MAG: alpha/beta hydrolase domain-containing protein [Prosthecobacter sp.]|nr:alpha/beta hydrolase domain-containing protein [Prosthecobacter sp.]
MSPLSRLILSGLCLASMSPAFAEVVRVEVLERSDVGNAGYEQITGKLHFEIDPKLPGNAVIADVDLASVNAAGKVSFVADLRLWKPKDDTRSNGAAWVEIPNRGGKSSLPAAMMAQGFTMLNVGWEFDVAADKLRLEVPKARNKDGSPIRGVVSAVFTTDKPLDEQALTDLTDYPPVAIEGAESRLIVRDRTAFPGGQEVPRKQWSLQNGRIRLEGGFEPGKTYEMFYLAEGPSVAGLGYAAIRDAVAWLKHDPASLAKVKHAYAFGSSQCGRFLRDFVYLGFNTDEQDRMALDGVMSHVAGAGRLVLNQRWSTPRSVAGYYTASYPFADTAQKDPVSGHAEGILANARVKHAPKIFYTNMAAEYWGAGRVAALTHTTPDGTKDIDLPENVRSYFFAGTSHGPASFPPTSQVKGSPLANPVSANASILALRMAMHRWIADGIAPPPSVYPKLSDGTLTPVVKVRFPTIPGMAAPNAVKAGGRVRNPQLADGAGEGTELPLLVPQVDADGNDLGGIRMPDIAVPLGTATGWVFRPAEFGSPKDFYLLRGAWVPFAKTKSQREAANDPRPSLEERYASKDAYLAKVKAVVLKLIDQGIMTESDLESQLKQAGERWDWVMRQTTP